MKTAIVEQLGLAGLERPAQVSAALAANDRAKFRLSLLQFARAHADEPDRPLPDLTEDCAAAGLAGSMPESIVEGTLRADAGYRIPGGAALLAALAEDVATMAVPLPEFAGRAAPLIAVLRAARDDVMSGQMIERLTRAGRDAELHPLIMDMHKALNRLQAELAEERIDGVAAYNLAEPDRELVRAFAAGVSRTAPLKFSHPGLGSTATRVGERLLIQNDIGTTDAHVLVVQIEGLVARVTYSDVHVERVAYFQNLFEGSGVGWSDTTRGRLDAPGRENAFTLTVGTYEAPDRAALAAFLDRLGSRLVFLIDWNKARKQLRDFLAPSQRIQLLRWAADNDIGHRGFLELGGARLVNEAIEATALGVIHFGDRLHDVLGEELAYRFLQFCFRVATEAMLTNQSPALVRDRVRAELAAQINASGYRLSLATGEHAAVIFELATSVHGALIGLVAGERGFDALPGRAKAWEHKADEYVVETRQLVRRRRDHEPFGRVIEAADDAADALEDAAFLIGLIGSGDLPAGPMRALDALAESVTRAAQEWVKAVAHVNYVRGLGTRDDAADFLTAVDRLGVLEHETDDGERRVTAAALAESHDFRQLHLLTALGDRLESTVDALRRASLILRDQVLSDVLA